MLGKNGPKLTKSEGDTNGLPGLYIRAPGMLEVRNATIADLAVTLQRSVLSRPVLDKTGLAGRWDFALEWTPDEEQFTGPPTSAPPRVEGKPDLVTALQNQLGLKMESAKSEVSTFVIEHLEKPTQN